MPILWGFTGFTSPMEHDVLDFALKPAQVFEQTQTFIVRVMFEIPTAFAPWVNHCHEFRLRVFAESIGPGPDEQIGEAHVRGVHNQTHYEQDITIQAHRLPADGDEVGPQVESLGLYRIGVALQHLNVTDPACPPPGQRVGTANSGATDAPRMIAIKRTDH